MSRSGAYKITSLKFVDANKARAQRLDERNDIRKTARQAQSNAKRGLVATPKASKSKLPTSLKENQAAVVEEVSHEQKLKERLARLKVWREQKMADDKKAKAKKKQPFLVPGVSRSEIPKSEPLAKRDNNVTIKKETKAVVKSNQTPRVTRSQSKKGFNIEKQWIVSSQEPKKPASSLKLPAPSFAPENFIFSAPDEIAKKATELQAGPLEFPDKEPFTFTSDTPQRPNNKSDEDVKISPLLLNNPWITTTRGSSSKKEQKRMSLAAGSSPDIQSSPLLKKRANSFANVHMNPHALHFRSLMSSEGSRLTDLCSSWDELLNNGDVPEDETGSVRTVIGQAHLLQRERFNQFAELVNQFENKTAEKPITPSDLEGFWEMIYLQVSDVDKKFQELSKLRANGWVKAEDAIGPKKTRSKVGAAKKKPVPGAGITAKSNMRAYILAARKNQLAAAIKSPGSPSVRRRSSLLMSPMLTPSKRQSLRRSVLISSAKKPVFVITDLQQKETGGENGMPPPSPRPALKPLELNEEDCDEGVLVDAEKAGRSLKETKKTHERTPRKELASTESASPNEERLSSHFRYLKSEASNSDSDQENHHMAPIMKVFRTPTKSVAPDIEPIKIVEEEVNEGSQVVHTPRRSIRLKNNQNNPVLTAASAGRVSLLPAATVSPVIPQDNLISFD